MPQVFLILQPNGIAANNQSQTNHLQIITNLYAKGVRTLILPNAVDISDDSSI